MGMSRSEAWRLWEESRKAVEAKAKALREAKLEKAVDREIDEMLEEMAAEAVGC